MRKPYFLQFAAAAGALGFALLAGSASAAPVIFDFTEPQGEFDPIERSADGSFTFTRGGITLTVTAGGSGANPASNPVLVRNRLPVPTTGRTGELGVVSGGQAFSRGAAMIRRGESLILSFSQTVQLGRIRILDLSGAGRDFLGEDAGHFYALRQLDGGSGQARVVPKELNFIPINPTLTGRRFELFIPDLEMPRNPFGSQNAVEFAFLLGAIEVIPEPSTALLTAAGLFALGFAGARRRGA